MWLGNVAVECGWGMWLENVKGDKLGHLGVDGKFLKRILEEIG
jgi:hypothetical protein